MKRLMIMERSAKILDILCFAIGREGYDIVPIRDGLDGISFLEQQAVDLIILDLTGPMDSIATCRCLREELLRQIWGYPGFLGDIRAVDLAIYRLRDKIEDDPAHPVFLVTKRGKGYLFEIE